MAVLAIVKSGKSLMKIRKPSLRFHGRRSTMQARELCSVFHPWLTWPNASDRRFGLDVPELRPADSPWDRGLRSRAWQLVAVRGRGTGPQDSRFPPLERRRHDREFRRSQGGRRRPEVRQTGSGLRRGVGVVRSGPWHPVLRDRRRGHCPTGCRTPPGAWPEALCLLRLPVDPHESLVAPDEARDSASGWPKRGTSATFSTAIMRPRGIGTN